MRLSKYTTNEVNNLRFLTKTRNAKCTRGNNKPGLESVNLYTVCPIIHARNRSTFVERGSNLA